MPDKPNRNAKIRESLATLKSSLPPVRNVIDVGVQHSTPPLIEAFPDSHHFLFEPVAEYHPFIHSHYKALRYTLVEAACSDTDAEVILHSERKTRGDEISHSYIVAKPTSTSRVVRSLSLDSYFASTGLTGPSLLKIDVEGPDVPTQILRGATQVLSSVDAVVIEMTVDRFMERAVLLHSAGFDLWDLCDLCYYGGCLWQADAVFIRHDVKEQHLALRPMHQKPFRPELWQSGF